MATSSEWPAADEVEVTLLGRGKGESCVVHLGGHRWMVVDSFNDEGTPVALTYLRDHLGVPDDHVKHIVVTHFHKDHYDGAIDLFEHYEHATLGLTAVADHKVFTQLHGVAGGDDVLGGLPELIATAKNRPIAGVTKALEWLVVTKDVINRTLEGDTAVADEPVRVCALSPSDPAVTATREEIAELLEPGTSSDQIRSSLHDRNLASVALHINVMGITVLLGGDLVADDDRGWQAVADHLDLQQLPKASLVKVSHHGSPGAHHDEAWEKFIEPGAVLLVAPYSSSGLPTPEDCARLGDLGDLWQAAPSHSGETPDSLVAMVEVDGQSLTELPKVGRIQARRRRGEAQWRVLVDPPAFPHEPN